MSVSVCLSVTVVHWPIIANLGFKFRSKFTAHCGRTRSACGRALRLAVHVGALWSRCMPGRGEGSSRAMLATARLLVYRVVGLHRAKAAYSHRTFPTTICWSVCLSVCPVQFGKTADRIWMQFGMVGQRGPGMRQVG